ncbi:MAG TPA: amidohydrolase family protein [Terriglobia bacterium]|nr:amidohydrolase family protein [Terriglobia bacterium]
MRRFLMFLVVVTIAGLVLHRRHAAHAALAPSVPLASQAGMAGPPVAGGFAADELRAFATVEPIDTHTHVFVNSPAFYSMLRKLHMHILDICVVDDHSPFEKSLQPQLDDALQVVRSSEGQASLCTTFDPFGFKRRGFAEAAVRQINQDFDHGAIAVKIWKNIGMELKDAKGNYILPDNPIFEPILRDIAAHQKTLVAHVADPNTLWEPPDPSAPDYSYYMKHPEWYMYRKPHPASKEAILRARDHLLEENPDLRVVGAHLGSMERDFDDIGRHLDRYPNFAVDLAARMPYVMAAPRERMIAFFTKYQDRITYGTDLGLHPGEDPAKAVREWEETYARDWRFFSTGKTVEAENHQKVQGLDLPPSVLRKLYHDNAVRWFPGIAAGSQ